MSRLGLPLSATSVISHTPTPHVFIYHTYSYGEFAYDQSCLIRELHYTNMCGHVSYANSTHIHETWLMSPTAATYAGGEYVFWCSACHIVHIILSCHWAATYAGGEYVWSCWDMTHLFFRKGWSICVWWDKPHLVRKGPSSSRHDVGEYVFSIYRLHTYSPASCLLDDRPFLTKRVLSHHTQRGHPLNMHRLCPL